MYKNLGSIKQGGMVGHIYKIKQSKSASQLHPKKTRRIRGNNIYIN
jgi:hypothetical protein